MGLIALVLFIIGLICKRKSPGRAKILIGIALGFNIFGLFRIMFSSMSNGAPIGISVFAVFIIIAMTIIMGITLSKIPDDAPKEQKKDKGKKKG